jgi:WD40 repeat protein
LNLARFSPDGGLIAFVETMTADRHGESGSHRLVVASTNQKSALFTKPLEGAPSALGFAPDGATVYAGIPADAGNATTRTSTLHRWDVKTGKEAELVRGVGTVLALTAEPARSLERIEPGLVHVREMTGDAQSPTPIAIQAGLRGAELFPDGQHVATFAQGEVVHIWSLAQPLPRDGNLVFLTTCAGRLSVTPDGERIVSFGADGGVVHHLSTKQNTWINQRDAMGQSAALSPDGSRLVVIDNRGRGGGQIDLIRLRDGARERVEPISETVSKVDRGSSTRGSDFVAAIMAAKVGKDGQNLYLCQDRTTTGLGGQTANPWLIVHGKETRAIETPGACVAAAFSPAGDLLSVLARVPKSPPPEPAPRAKAARAPAKNPALMPRRPQVSAQAEHILLVYSVADGKIVQRTAIGVVGEVRSLGFSRDGSRVELNWRSNSGRAGPTAGYSYAAIDAKSGREIVRRSGLSRAPIILSPDGRLLARGDNNAIVLEDLSGTTQPTRFDLRSGLLGLAFSPDARWLYSSSQDFAIRRWETPRTTP